MRDVGKGFWKEILLFTALIVPLLYQFSAKNLWNDEFYSLFSALSTQYNLSSEPHSFIYFWALRPFIELFGVFSPFVHLFSLVPSVLALGMLFALGKRLGGVWMGFCLCLVLSLNPIFLQFARSMRGNSFLYIMPIMIWWGRCFLEKKHQHWFHFFVVFISANFQALNIPVSFVVLFIYEVFTNFKEAKTARKIWMANILAAMMAVSALLIKYYFYMENWPGSYSLTTSLVTLNGFYRYFFFSATESFSLVWSDEFYSYQELFQWIPLFYLVTSLGITYCWNKKNFRLQFIFLITLIVIFITVWCLGYFTGKLLVPRNHLIIFFLFQMIVGVGLGSIPRHLIRLIVLGVFISISVYHLGRIHFYSQSSQELEVIKQAEKEVLNGGHLIVCSYPEKLKLTLSSKTLWSFGCTDQEVDGYSKMFNRLVILKEFFNPGVDRIVQKLQSQGWKVREHRIHFSKFFILEK